MEMVAPRSQDPPLPAVENAEDTIRQVSGRSVTAQDIDIVAPPANTTPGVLWSNEEEIITVENELYTAVVSSNGGGSFLSFTFKDYLNKDSLGVNLINGKNKENLSIRFKTLMVKMLIYLSLGITLIRFLVVKYTDRSHWSFPLMFSPEKQL